MTRTVPRDPTAPGGPPPPLLRVFTEEALERLRLGDEPPSAAEAELSGPWQVERLGDGWGIFRHGDREAGEPPLGRFADRHLALLAAAVVPGLGRAGGFRVEPEGGDSGYPVRREGAEAGALAVFLSDLAPALDVVDALVRSPHALALLLEAAGPTALERAGRELGLRLVAAPS